jgi:hypothetical protein
LLYEGLGRVAPGFGSLEMRRERHDR